MPAETIDLRRPVEQRRDRAIEAARRSFEDTLLWLTDATAPKRLHEVDDGLWRRLMRLGVLLVGVWLVHQLPDEVPAVLRRGGAWYGEVTLSHDWVRSRFGEVGFMRPVYRLVHGHGDLKVSPMDRQIGLAAGRMSLAVHLQTAWLCARMAYDQAVEVLGGLSGYAPSKRAALGVVAGLGPQAMSFLMDLPVPEDDGDILVIQVDGKGAPMISSREHQRRCRPHAKRPRGMTRRGLRRWRRQRWDRRRRKSGPSKNAKMATFAVIYTLRRLSDGSLEGPLNKRVLGTFRGMNALFAMAQVEARKRGYGQKRTVFLADGALALWSHQERYFPLATPCLDWYHLSEYLWTAGGTVHPEGSDALRDWVRCRQAQLRKGDVDGVLSALQALTAVIDGSGTDGRLKRLAACIRYVENHRHLLPYRELLAEGLDIATGAVEGAVKHVAGVRLDGSGMHWGTAGAESVLALRCVLINGDWPAFADRVAKTHEVVDAWTVPRVTLTKKAVPHDAVRKAA